MGPKKAAELQHWAVHQSVQTEIYAIKTCVMENI